MGLIDDLGSGPVAVDTAPFIYFIEEHPDYLPVLEPVFAEADRGNRMIVTSSVTLLEVLVLPFRVANLPLADRYEALLTRSRGLTLVEMDRDQIRAGAQVRAVYGLGVPDALQVAAALSWRCKTLVTSDRQFADIPGVNVLQLRDYA